MQIDCLSFTKILFYTSGRRGRRPLQETLKQCTAEELRSPTAGGGVFRVVAPENLRELFYGTVMKTFPNSKPTNDRDED